MVRETRKYELDILVIQEIRWEGQDSIRQGKYTFYHGGTQSHDFGTGFLIKNSILQAVQNIKFVNERLSYVKAKTKLYRPTIGKYSLHEKTNNNGERLITFAISKNLLIKSTYFEYKDIHKYTWISPNSRSITY